MPRKPQPWFRFYTEAFNDRKILRLTPVQRWVWVAILGAARESPTPGHLLVHDGLPMTRTELARYAAVRPQDITSSLKIMEQLGMITASQGLIAVTNWEGRQYESDNVTARTQAHRERHKTNGYERSNEQGRNVPTNVRRNTPDTDTDTDTDTEDQYLRPLGD